jgi:hypothetical protein
MKKKIGIFMMMAGLAGLMVGCVRTANDETQFGIPGLKDDSQAQYERSVPQILAAATTVMNAEGQLNKDNSFNHSLRGKVKGVNIYIRVDEVDVSKPLSRIVIQARSPAGVADPDLAQYLQTEIALKLQAQQ